MCLQYYNDSNDNELYSKRHSLYAYFLKDILLRICLRLKYKLFKWFLLNNKEPMILKIESTCMDLREGYLLVKGIQCVEFKFTLFL